MLCLLHSPSCVWSPCEEGSHERQWLCSAKQQLKVLLQSPLNSAARGDSKPKRSSYSRDRGDLEKCILPAPQGPVRCFVFVFFKPEDFISTGPKFNFWFLSLYPPSAFSWYWCLRFPPMCTYTARLKWWV